MTGRREALIIATGDYEDAELRRLRAPGQDAVELQQVLTDPDIGNFQVRAILNESAREISLAMQEFFADRGLDDVLLVHISCHGVKDDDGRLYFAAKDTRRKWLASTAVSAAFLNEQMERCRARSLVLLLDCCYSGAFVPGAKGDSSVDLKEKFEGEGRAIITASNAIEYSWEGDDLSGVGVPSIFTGAIVDGLGTGEADRDGDGLVSIDDLYRHVYETVRREKPQQTPKIWTFGIENALYIARNRHRAVTRAAPTAEVSPSVALQPRPDDVGRVFLSNVRKRLEGAGFTCLAEVGWGDSRFSLVAHGAGVRTLLESAPSSLGFFVFDTFNRQSPDELRAFSARCFEYCKESSGVKIAKTFCFCVSVVEQPDEATILEVRQKKPPKHKGGAEIPVLVDLRTRAAHYYQSVWWAAGFPAAGKIIDAVLVPAAVE